MRRFFPGVTCCSSCSGERVPNNLSTRSTFDFHPRSAASTSEFSVLIVIFPFQLRIDSCVEFNGTEHPSPLAVCRHLNRCLISSKCYDIQAKKFSSPENRPMRKSKAETAKTRERILEAASAQFLSHGITEAGLAPLMRAAGLTHGGFYRHFAAKDQLVAEACRQAVLSVTSGVECQIDGKP